jgi:outer membrane protein TolC
MFRIVCLIAAVIFLPSVGLVAQQPHVERVTLDEAKARAGAAKAADLARLSIDAARYHRQAVQADYFPKIDSTFANLHFNKFMGQSIELARRTAELPLLRKDETIAVVNVTQPVTPLFKVNQAVTIARADEAIARAKVGQLAAQVAAKVERTYFALLIAQRQQTLAEIKTQMMDRPVLIEVGKELLTARSQVVELTENLNALIGLDPHTELELIAPEPVVETVSEQEATQQALANSSEIVEAEQTVVKARAATNLSKLEYVPDVAVIGGYSYQTAIPLLPRDFTFIGVIATLNIFDFGKREKTASERKTQLEMAQANVDLVRAKVAASAQKAFLDLQRTRKIRDLTRQLANVYQVTPVSYQDPGLKAKADRAKAEEDMFQAELDYRLAYSQLKQVIEGR